MIFKKFTLLKSFAVAGFALFITATSLDARAIKKNATAQFHTEQDLVQHSINDIKEKLREKNITEKDVNFVRCIYELNGKNLVSSTTKIHVTTYRQDTTFLEDSFNANAKVTKKYEIVYKPNEKDVDLKRLDTNKKGKKVLERKEFKISPVLFCENNQPIT